MDNQMYKIRVQQKGISGPSKRQYVCEEVDVPLEVKKLVSHGPESIIITRVASPNTTKESTKPLKGSIKPTSRKR